MPYLHPFHLLSPSMWPLAASISLFNLMVCLSGWLNALSGVGLAVIGALLSVALTIGFWWRDVTHEASWSGDHTFEVKRGLSYGMALFVTTEVLVFFSLFWAYFHSALAPVLELGVSWPPAGVVALDAKVLPLLNTLLLLASGCTVTYAHHALVGGSRNGVGVGILTTLLIALLFTALQGVEYANSSFTLIDGIYGSAFYVTTGTHGFHVVVGSVFLAVGAARTLTYAATETHHKNLESAIVYWHMVDVVWLFLYGAVY